MQKKYFQRSLFLISAILLTLVARSQPSTSQNYVIANGVKLPGITFEAGVNSLPISTQGKVQTITYFDGLGRPMQTVVTSGSASQKDIITGVEYDQYGREIKKYLPFSDLNNLGNSASYRPVWKTAQSTFYNGSLQGVDADAAPFSQSILESSPLNRILAQGAPGTTWQPNINNAYDATVHAVQMQYLVNTASDNVRIFSVDASGNISSPGTYPAGQLSVKLNTDEQGQQVKEFTDKDGHVILKIVYLANDMIQTYYIYDDLELLRAVIQPEGVASIAATGSWSPDANFEGKWMFLYRYDERNRMVMKKVPGADSVLMVYDQWDRVVLTQDGNLRTQSSNNWLFTKYDQLNRPVVTGLITDTRAQSAIRTDVTNSTGRFETINTSATEGYTLNNSFPSSSSYTITVNTTTHYDSYNNIPSSWASGYSFVNEYGVASQNTFLLGQVIASQSKILGTSNYMRSVSYFDDRYRSIQATADNAAGGKDRVTKILSFDGKSLNDYHNHTSRFYTSPLLIQQTYTYDHVDRLLQVTHQTGTQEIVTLTQNQYNELGQLLNKKLHQSSSHPNYLQKLDYSYNIRGWLTAINRPTGTAQDYDESDLFNMELHYNTTEMDNARPQFNGNIAEEVWKGGYDEYVKAYRYYYDQANRLDTSMFGIKESTPWGDTWYFNLRYDEDMDYDHNGNILDLYRFHGDWSCINSLHYSQFNGNQVGAVINYAQNPANIGFYSNQTPYGNALYTYDANGNVITNTNKGITATTYNFLNLPTLITIPGKGTIAFTYDASGNKLQKTTTDQTVTPNKVTNYYYAGDFVYRNDTLEFISHSEGRLRPVRIDTTQAISVTNLKYLYDYFLKDHLGSTRSVISTEQETDIYAATMEASAATVENQLFSNISSTTTAKPGGFDTDNSNTQVSILNGNINTSGNKRVGPAIVLKVMAGDTISVSTYAWYQGATQQPPSGLTPIINDLLPLLTNGAVAEGATHAGAWDPSDINDDMNGILNDFLSNTQPNNYNNSRPKAFLNWVVVDEEFNAVSSPGHEGAIQVPTISGSMQKQQMIGPANMVVRRNGWLYVYLSNEANQNVYFDNLVINHKRGPLVEQKDYYPFGLEIPGLSTQAAKPSTYIANRYEYNGKEKQNKEFIDGTGLDEYDYGARMYDPEIARWGVVDPMADKDRRWSPYRFAYDNPLRFIDPDGMNEDDYYDKQSGKYLGSDNSKTTDMRLVDVSTYENYKYNQQANDQTSEDEEKSETDLHNNSSVISVDDNKIQSDLQNARDNSVGSDKVENQVYIYLDTKSSTITSTPGPPGNNNSTTMSYTTMTNGALQAQDKDGNRLHYTILIGQAHSHPDSNEPDKVTQSAMSDLDQNTSKNTGIPIYGIDAMSGSGKKGASANINRANPSGSSPTNNVGKTKGSGAGTFNIGRQALEISSGKVRD